MPFNIKDFYYFLLLFKSVSTEWVTQLEYPQQNRDMKSGVLKLINYSSW